MDFDLPRGDAKVYALTKEETPEGTWEDSDVAFQLYMGAVPRVFGSFGFATLPQVGCYSAEDYTPFLPIVCLSVPLLCEEPRSLAEQLPAPLSKAVQTLLGRGAVETVDCFVSVHSGWAGRPCEHLECHSTDEASMMYHSWTFQEDNMDYMEDGGDISAAVYMGIYEPVGVAPVHQDLQDGGVPFGALGARSVITHGRRFSPNNANFRILPPPASGSNGAASVVGAADAAAPAAGSASSAGRHFPTWWALGVDTTVRRAVLSLHCLPIGDAAADRVRASVKGVRTLGGLLDALRGVGAPSAAPAADREASSAAAAAAEAAPPAAPGAAVAGDDGAAAGGASAGAGAGATTLPAAAAAAAQPPGELAVFVDRLHALLRPLEARM